MSRTSWLPASRAIRPLPRAGLLALSVGALILSGCVQETTIRHETTEPASGSQTKDLKCGSQATIEVEYRVRGGDFLVFVQDGNDTMIFSEPFTSGSGDKIWELEGKAGTWHVTVSRDAYVGLADVLLKC